MPAPAQKALSADIESKILSATPDNIQEIVFNHAEILYPYFCRWPIFWPWFFRVVEQEVVYTDCNGYFDGWLLSFGAPVAENVYIWIEASIGGTWVTVYRPPFPCNTHWDYACGTDINITLNNSAIPPCSCDAPVVDGSVWFTAIGSSAIALNIQQNEVYIIMAFPWLVAPTSSTATNCARLEALWVSTWPSGPDASRQILPLELDLCL